MVRTCFGFGAAMLIPHLLVPHIVMVHALMIHGAMIHLLASGLCGLEAEFVQADEIAIRRRAGADRLSAW